MHHGDWLEDALNSPGMSHLDKIKCIVKLPKAILEVSQDRQMFNQNGYVWNLYTKTSGNIMTALFTGKKLTDYEGNPFTEKDLKKWEALTGVPIEKRHDLLKGLKLYKFPAN